MASKLQSLNYKWPPAVFEMMKYRSRLNFIKSFACEI